MHVIQTTTMTERALGETNLCKHRSVQNKVVKKGGQQALLRRHMGHLLEMR